ncbi:hypothetical protein FOFC_06045 [Fusarium oxysporum]|nr:hypothetical protein FOFC_06045 [Fusarium oxysporum]
MDEKSSKLITNNYTTLRIPDLPFRSAGMSRGSVKTGGELGLRLGELWAVECGPRDYGSGQQWISPNESDAGSWP